MTPAAVDDGTARRWAQLAWLSAAMFLGMTLWFSATAVTAPIAAEFRFSAGETAWLTMAVQAGFVAGTLAAALTNLPDVVNARHLFAVGCAIGASANGGLVFVHGAAAIVALRLLTGVALAWVYPPGLKIAAGWFLGKRGTALGVLVGALTIGSAFPHLLAAVSAALQWRTVVVMASALALTGGAIVLLTVGDGPYVTKNAPFDPHAIARVFQDRSTRLATLGYLGHMWELYAVWTWIATFAAASLYARAPDAGAAPIVRAAPLGSAIAFVTIASGAVGSAAAGWLADRVGQARVAAAAMLTSGTCAIVAGFTFGATPALLFALGIVWGVAVVADSAQLSALVANFSPREHVGTALTIQTSLGFLLTLASIRLIPVVARASGWQWAFLCLVPGPFLGAFAISRLTTD